MSYGMFMYRGLFGTDLVAQNVHGPRFTTPYSLIIYFVEAVFLLVIKVMFFSLYEKMSILLVSTS